MPAGFVGNIRRSINDGWTPLAAFPGARELVLVAMEDIYVYRGTCAIDDLFHDMIFADSRVKELLECMPRGGCLPACNPEAP